MLNSAKLLTFLECEPGALSVRSLNRLIYAYVQKVPWESVSRIAKRAVTPEPSQCPRWPEEFWQDAIRYGTGGTCFETNYAFFYLLRSLGYSGYLTVNDMGDQRGCHAAIMVDLNGQKYLVDVGIPLLTALPVDPGRVVRRTTWLHTYSVCPDGANRYQVLRSRHPKPNIYTLLDTPIHETDYRQVIEQDYGENGLFLNRVIIVKIIGERLWRFSSADIPYRMEWFSQEDRGEQAILPGQVTRMLADQFQMDELKIEEAFRALKI